ncbi:MAG: SpvB/TcaC N-terminal domain-containing protein, partial [Myxococcota bacterium]
MSLRNIVLWCSIVASLFATTPIWADPNVIRGDLTEEVGSLPGALSVGPGGEAQYSLPFEFPAGRGGLTPTLSLTYRSDRGNGVAGVGWSLQGVSQLRRCPHTLRLNGVLSTSSEVTNWCLDGTVLVRVADGATTNPDPEYRTFPDTGVRARHMESGWRVDSPDGTTRVFDTLGRLVSVEDKLGNRIEYTYSDNSYSKSRLDKIAYNYVDGRQEGSAPYHEVLLSYSGRPDNYTGAIPWHESENFNHAEKHVYRTSGRLERITVRQDHHELYTYTLSYETSGGWPQLGTGRSLLRSVTRCADGWGPSDDGGIAWYDMCLPPTTFEYNASQATFELVQPNLPTPTIASDWYPHPHANPLPLLTPLGDVMEAMWPIAQEDDLRNCGLGVEFQPSLAEDTEPEVCLLPGVTCAHAALQACEVGVAVCWEVIYPSCPSVATQPMLPVMATDMNGDGASELIFASAQDGNELVWLSATATPGAANLYQAWDVLSTDPSTVADNPGASLNHRFVDLTGTGQHQLIYLTESGSITVFAVDGSYAHAYTAADDAFIVNLQVADLDGDNRQEVLTCQAPWFHPVGRRS